MKKSKKKSPAQGTWMDKISDLFGDTEKNLDQVKKAVQEDLKNLKKHKEFESLAVNLMMTAEEGFKKDLDEIGIVGEAQAEYLELFKQNWQKMEMKKKSAEILNSPELAALDGFVTKLENLPKLKEVVESAEPQPKWQAMLAGFSSQIPGLDKFVNEYFGPVLESIGLGFLVKPKKKKAEGEKKGKKDAGKKKSDKGKKPPEKQEAAEVLKKPGNTLLLGDSNNAAFDENLQGNKHNATKFKEAIDIDGEVKVLSKGAMPSIWVKNQLESKPASYFTGIENAIVLTGSNDLGSDKSADAIWENLKSIYSILKRHGIKVYACTLPPVKGHKVWKERMEKDVEPKRKALNKKIRESGLAHHVIDLDAKQEEGGAGGVANASGEIAEEYRRFTGDYVHVDGGRLAEIYKRELRAGRNKKSKKKDNVA